ncbi:MAG: DUF3293 domain-containing protein [Wenzhouxiangellaceae bacterium]|nr:DUF3293 domain-containing protein [Wenzhouxiangellaceae bacterium]
MQNLANAPEPSDPLIAAFAAAEYRVDTGATSLTVELGSPSPALDRLLDGRPWAIITAHNPDGRLQSKARNAAAHLQLDQCLGRVKAAVCLPACNRDRSGKWPDEPGWLFTPNSMADADRLARRFGQRAIVTGGDGQRAELRVYDTGSTSLPDFARAVRS